MAEPFLTQFRDLIRAGAGTLDIHDGQQGTPLTREALADERLVEREVERVPLHLASICRILERSLPPGIGSVLDVGCGTGATTVAVALSKHLAPTSVVGIDPNRSSLRAAEVRAAGYGLSSPRVRFEAMAAGAPIPAADGTADLTLCVSVIEYIRTPAERQRFAAELVRVTRPGGAVCLVTPSPYRLFDYHTHRLLGDWRRVEGYPWSSTRREIRAMFAGMQVKFLDAEQVAVGLQRRGLPGARLLTPFARFLPWQKVLVRTPGAR